MKDGLEEAKREVIEENSKLFNELENVYNFIFPNKYFLKR